MTFGSINVDTITGSGASSVIVNNGTNNVAGFTTGNNLQMLQNGGGIVFSNSSATTNSTLNDYEYGTVTVTDASGAGLTFTNSTGYYTKVGRLVTFSFDLNYPSTANSSQAKIALPFTGATAGPAGSGAVGYCNYSGGVTAYFGATTYITFYPIGGGSSLTNANLSGKEINVVFTYQANF